MPSRGCRGFSLLELLCVLALLGILTGIASLQLAPLLQRVAVNSGVRQVAADLQLVRMQAIAHNRRLRVTFQPGFDTYLVEKRENGRWQDHRLHSHDSGGDGSGSILLPTSVIVSAANSRGDVIFVPRGHVDGGMTLTLASPDGTFSKRIVINLAGRVRIN